MDAQLRAEDWPVRLAEAVEEARSRRFAWGEHDCATWAFSVAHRLRDEAPPAWIGTYGGEFGATRALRERGLALEDMGTVILGAPLASPLMAQRGDVVLAGGAYGVCIGSEIAQVGKDGLELRPLTAAERAWRV